MNIDHLHKNYINNSTKLSSSIQLFHVCLGNSQNCCPEVPWTARCTIARGLKAEGNGASSCPRYRRAVVFFLLPNLLYTE